MAKQTFKPGDLIITSEGKTGKLIRFKPNTRNRSSLKGVWMVNMDDFISDEFYTEDEMRHR